MGFRAFWSKIRLWKFVDAFGAKNLSFIDFRGPFFVQGSPPHRIPEGDTNDNTFRILIQPPPTLFYVVFFNMLANLNVQGGTS